MKGNLSGEHPANKMTITVQADLPTEKEVRNFELKNSIILPPHYRIFLMENNPKKTDRVIFKLSDTQYSIHCWLPLSSKETISLESTLVWTHDLLKGKYLAFAYDPGDWLFVISVNSSDYGKVFFCRPDEELEDGLTLLADNFTEFLRDLLTE